MSITGTIGLIAGLGSSILGGVVQGNAAQTAAQQQESKAAQAQALELQNQQAGINFQTNEWGGLQAAERPYQQLGSTGAVDYTKLLSKGFQAPTLAQAEATPGYQFNLQTGTQAIDEQAAATGNLNSGNTGVALQKFGQGLATTTYQQAYNNALNTYGTNLAAAGNAVNTGLTSTAQLGQYGQAAANNLSNLYLTGGQQQASQLNNQGAAAAAGTMGQANAYANMFNGAANSITQGAILNSLSQPQLPANDTISGTFNPNGTGGTQASYANPYANIYNPAPYSGLNIPSPALLDAGGF